MSRASPLMRALPRSTVRPAVRSYHTSLSSQAATASAPSPRPTTPRRVAVPASAARLSRAAPPKPLTPAQTQARVAPTAPLAGVEDEFDMPMPEMEPIEDYAHPAQSASSSSTPRATPPSSAPRAAVSNTRSSFGDITPSPPLTSFPNDGYRPLPTTAAGEGLGVGLGDNTSDWSTSFAGLSQKPFDREVADALLRPLQVADIELKPGKYSITPCLPSLFGLWPLAVECGLWTMDYGLALITIDGLLYLPEIKYRRTLNAAFGPGGWGLAPRGETHVGPRIVSREWGLVCLGR